MHILTFCYFTADMEAVNYIYAPRVPSGHKGVVCIVSISIAGSEQTQTARIDGDPVLITVRSS